MLGGNEQAELLSVLTLVVGRHVFEHAVEHDRELPSYVSESGSRSWPGQAWDPQWRRINSVGAARWFGIREGRWDITLEELRQWDPQAAALDVPFLEEAPDMLQMLATIALIRLAFTRLSAQS